MSHMNYSDFRMMDVRLEVFTAMKYHVVVFWVVPPCRYMVGYQHFGGSCCLYRMDGQFGFLSYLLTLIMPKWIYYTKNYCRETQTI